MLAICAEVQTEASFLFFHKPPEFRLDSNACTAATGRGFLFHRIPCDCAFTACVRIFRERHASLACLSKAAFLRQSWTCGCRLQCRPPSNLGLVGAERQTARGDPTLRENNFRSAGGKLAGAVTPLENVPRRAPCQEAAGVVTSSAPQRDRPVTRVRTALARAKMPVHRGAKRERGSTQLAAASEKRHQKVRLSQR